MTHQHIHLVNPLKNPAGGSEWRTLSLYRELVGKVPVTLWCDGHPDPGITADCPLRYLSGKRLSFPLRGTIVLMGVYFEPGHWIWLSRPRRVIILYNTPDKERLEELLRRLRRARWPRPEMVYCSELSQEEAGIPGRVETSIVDLETFASAPRALGRPFTVGRLSRASPRKHHPDDLAFYERLAEAGCRVRVMGASDEMIAAAPANDRIELMPINVEPAASFLQGIDAFFYRTDPSWIEPWGRVIVEAMASGLPVVGNEGGYTRLVKTGENGFIFKSENEAFDILIRLRDDQSLRTRVGRAAQVTTSEIITTDMKDEIVRYYIGAAP